MFRKKMKGLRGVQSTHRNHHEVIGTCRMGKLYPVFCRIVPPRTKLNIKQAIDIRLEPTIRPLQHTITASLHTWKVPLRLLWRNSANADDNFVSYITNPDSNYQPPYIGVQPERSNPLNLSSTVLDYLGYPIDTRFTAGGNPGVQNYSELRASAFPLRAYMMVYDTFYRHQHYIGTIFKNNSPQLNGGLWNADVPGDDDQLMYAIRKRCWPADDYFMRVLPSPQKGGAVQIPQAVGGNIPSVRDLTLAYQLQGFREQQNIGGSRYNEHLRTHFGCAPRDETLQLPQYLGGGKGYVSMPEVVQTSQTTVGSGGSPQANRAGLGRALIASNEINHFFDEDCVVITLMSIMPKATYSGGLDKMYRLTTLTDFILPEFNFLGDDPVLRQELRTTTPGEALRTVLGFVPRNEHHRHIRSYYCGEMRPNAPVDQAFWHLGRDTTEVISINRDFVECNPDEDRVFAVPSRDTVVYHCYNMVTASLPLPKSGMAKFTDHK